MNRKELADMGYENSLAFIFPSYDDAIVGVTTDDRIVYSYDLMVEQMMKDTGCDYHDAVDWLEYNTIRALSYMGEGAPVIVTFL